MIFIKETMDIYVYAKKFETLHKMINFPGNILKYPQ